MRECEFDYADDGRSFLDERIECWSKEPGMTSEIMKEIKEGMMENEDQIHKVTSFVALHKENSLTPDIEEKYWPVGILLNGPQNRLEIHYSESPVKLIKLPLGSNDYTVKSNNIVQKFPGNINKYSSLGDTFFYNNQSEGQQVIQMAILSLLFDGWKLHFYVIGKDGQKREKLG